MLSAALIGALILHERFDSAGIRPSSILLGEPWSGPAVVSASNEDVPKPRPPLREGERDRER